MIGFRGLPQTYGGGEEFIRYLAPGLVNKGHTIIVYCHDYLFDDKTKYYQGVTRIFIPTIKHKWLGQFLHSSFAVVDLLFRKVDIVYIHTLPSGLHAIIPFLFRKKIVVNTDGLDWERDKWGRIAKMYFRLSAKVVCKVANELISDAMAIREYYLKKFNRDSTYIAYGANIESSEHPQLINEFKVNPEEYYLVACRLVPENNIDLIVKGFHKSKSNKKLIIAGTANYKSKYLSELISIKDDRINFIGHISDYSKVKELHCNCFAYLHGHSLGGTNPSILKALGYGNLVLALDSPFNKEVLANKYGLTFEKSEQSFCNLIHHVENNDLLVKQYKELAPKRIQSFYSWEKIINEYNALFIKVFHQNNKSL